MRDRLKKLSEQNDGSSHLPQANVAQSESTFVVPNDVKGDALSALVALGYKPAQATKVVNSVYSEGASSEELIRDALRSMV
jgi:Holliday junction DNA helicase RuvA